MSALIKNSNIAGVHFPGWEWMPQPAPVASAAGACICSDDKRYIYYLVSATSFWRLDTWTGVPEQLAPPTGGTVGAGTCMIYTTAFGGMYNGIVYGAIFALITSGTGAPVFNKYDIATNAWSNLNVTNLPATFGTEGSLCFPDPDHNNYEAGYHSTVLNTITCNADVALNAVTMSVTALPKALVAGTVLNFGTKAAPKQVVLTANASAAAVSLTIAPSNCVLTSGLTALYYDHAYLIGNNATQMYRFQFSTSAWSTTSANSGTPALAAMPNTIGAGGTILFLPGMTWPSGIVSADQLVVVRGTGSSTLYRYDLTNNTAAIPLYQPSTETFTTGSSFTHRYKNGKATELIGQKEITQKFFRFDFSIGRKEPIAFQDLAASGAALVGNRMCIINQSGVDFIYTILSTSTYFLRHPIIF